MSGLTRIVALRLSVLAAVVALPLMGATAYSSDRSRTVCVGELNGDNVVDLTDLALLLKSYGLCLGNLDYSPYADIDGSGCANLSDLAVPLAVAIDDACPPGYSCLASSTAAGDEYWHHTEMVHLMPGTYYVIVDTWPSADCIPVFELTFNYPPP